MFLTWQPKYTVCVVANTQRMLPQWFAMRIQSTHVSSFCPVSQIRILRPAPLYSHRPLSIMQVMGFLPAVTLPRQRLSEKDHVCTQTHTHTHPHTHTHMSHTEPGIIHKLRSHAGARLITSKMAECGGVLWTHLCVCVYVRVCVCPYLDCTVRAS